MTNKKKYQAIDKKGFKRLLVNCKEKKPNVFLVIKDEGIQLVLEVNCKIVENEFSSQVVPINERISYLLHTARNDVRYFKSAPTVFNYLKEIGVGDAAISGLEKFTV